MDFKKIIFDRGRADALTFQKESSKMSGTELYQKDQYIISFLSAKANQNMLARPIGFICRSTEGRIVKLIQPYDSDIFPDEPENLPAQWGFVWSKNFQDALPFISLSTSPYNIDEVCSYENKIYASLIDNNIFSPKDYPSGWKLIE